MKLKDVLVARNALEEIKYRPVQAEADGPVSFAPVRMPAKLAYAIEKNLRMMEPDLKAHEAARLKILENAGVKPGEKLPDDKQEEANAEYQKLIDTEVEFMPYKIRLELFGGLELTADQMGNLFWMVEEE